MTDQKVYNRTCIASLPVAATVAKHGRGGLLVLEEFFNVFHRWSPRFQIPALTWNDLSALLECLERLRCHAVSRTLTAATGEIQGDQFPRENQIAHLGRRNTVLPGDLRRRKVLSSRRRRCAVLSSSSGHRKTYKHSDGITCRLVGTEAPDVGT